MWHFLQMECRTVQCRTQCLSGTCCIKLAKKFLPILWIKAINEELLSLFLGGQILIIMPEILCLGPKTLPHTIRVTAFDLEVKKENHAKLCDQQLNSKAGFSFNPYLLSGSEFLHPLLKFSLLPVFSTGLRVPLQCSTCVCLCFTDFLKDRFGFIPVQCSSCVSC